MSRCAVPSIAVIAFGLCVGCGEDERLLRTEPQSDASIGFDDAAHDELVAAGADKYLGKFHPSKVTPYSTFDAYEFEPRDDGPTCIYGSPFRVSVRDVGSKDVLIYLQGGGACWSDICAANEDASLGVMPIAWTDADPERNPPLAGFNVVFVAYCDGSVFSGDNVIHAADGSVERRHRGLANLSAALDVARSLYPAPRRIVLAGSSAGGYGTIVGTIVTRLAYPHTPLFVMDDAGPGVTNPNDPSLLNGAKNEWRALDIVPKSCQGCVESGQFTTVIDWSLTHDPSLQVASFSALEDAIIGNVFLGMKGPEFGKVLLAETGKVHAHHPDRYQRYFWPGGAHTAVLAGYYDLEIEGTSLIDFVQAMLVGSPVWRDLVDTAPAE
jgi:hypothetical protein